MCGIQFRTYSELKHTYGVFDTVSVGFLLRTVMWKQQNMFEVSREVNIIQNVSEERVNILGGGSMDYSE
jgi:hypothetical protein